MKDESREPFDGAVADFERLLDRPDVDTADDSADLITQFERLAERFAAIQPELTDLKSELPTDGDGDGFPAAVFTAEEPVVRWRERHPEQVAEVRRLFEEYQSIFERIDVSDADVESPEEHAPAVEALMEKIVVWKTIIESPVD